VFGIVSMTLSALATTALASPPPSGGLAAFWDGTTDCFFRTGPNESDVVFEHGPFADGANEVYFPAVGYDNDFGLGEANTSITVQNIDVDDAYIFIFVGGQGFTDYAYLSAGASKTFRAEDLGIDEGKVKPVWVFGFNQLFVGDDSTCHLAPVFLAGVAKQAVTGDNLPYTTSADTSVSGYNAISGRELGFFDQLYFPIVQTNCGPGGCWDTILRIANFGIDRNAAVTVTFFPADDGSGSLNSGFQLQALVDRGQTWSIDLADWVPQGWVGSARVFTDDAVAAIADRFKVGTDMWITNTASNAQAEAFWQFPFGPANAPYVLFAPDVRTDWNGWNTGINVANTVDADNHVWIQYFGSNGNAPLAQDQLLHAQGMTYFYNPSNPSEDDCQQPASDVPGCEYIGGALIFSEAPVAVAVDGVKYFGNDANVGQAFSYAATSNAYTDLAAPLVQKGNPATGMGATSGINFMNPNADATVVTTTWINPSGFAASNFADSVVWVPGFSTGFVYTMFHHNLPNGFYGSALVTTRLADTTPGGILPTAEALPIIATTADVDYQVQGDGTVVWNLFNPCGFFRFSGFPGDDPDCVFQSPTVPPTVQATITKEVICSACDVADQNVAGATVTYEGTTDTGFDINGSGITGSTGAVTFAVPAGTYTLTLTSLPAGYDQSAVGETDTVTVAEGDAATITDDVSQASATKIVDTNVAGAFICVFDEVLDQSGKPVPPTGPCLPEMIPVKGSTGGGQGVPNEFVALLNGGGGDVSGTADVHANDSTHRVTADVAAQGVAPGLTVFATLESLTGGGSATCADTGATVPVLDLGSDSADAGGNVFVSFAQTLSSSDFSDLGNLENAIVVLRDSSGSVVACGQLEEGTFRLETPAEMAARLGARAVAIADADGNATFSDLPAGCYFVVVSDPNGNFEDAIERFCLAPGQTETNVIDLTPITQPDEGTLTKGINVSDFDPFIGDADSDFHLLSEIAFCDASLVGGNTNPDDVAASGFCDSEFDPATVAYGGFDNYFNEIGPTFEFSADVNAGDYFICLSAAVVGDFDADPTTPDEAVTVPYHCEGPFTVTAGNETFVPNDFAAEAVGTLDVFVRDDDTDAPIADATVCLFDDSNAQVGCTTTGADGLAHFFDVPNGVYTTNADADGCELGESTQFTYNVLDDAFDGFVMDAAATADRIQSLDCVVAPPG